MTGDKLNLKNNLNLVHKKLYFGEKKILNFGFQKIVKYINRINLKKIQLPPLDFNSLVTMELKSNSNGMAQAHTDEWKRSSLTTLFIRLSDEYERRQGQQFASVRLLRMKKINFNFYPMKIRIEKQNRRRNSLKWV